MSPVSRYSQPLLLAALVVALGTTSGCHWFKRHNDYQKSRETQPLEVPPDLNLPDTSGATTLPPAGSLGSGRANASGAAGFNVAGSSAEVWAKVGDVLGQLDGVNVTGKAEALGSYDINFQNQNFLIRVTESGGQSRVLAISPDGQVLTGGAAGELLKAIKSRL